MWPPNWSSQMAKKLPPVHPGEILREEFLVPLKLTPYAVAAALNVPRTRIERIAREEKPVTADTALRLGKFFQDRGCVLDEYSGALRSRNGRRRARSADQEDRVLRASVRRQSTLLSAILTERQYSPLRRKRRHCGVAMVKLALSSARSCFFGEPGLDQGLIGHITLVSGNFDALKKCHRQAKGN